MNLYCKDCKHLTFFDRDCKESGYAIENVVTGKTKHHYSSALSYRTDGCCGIEGNYFEPSKWLLFKEKVNEYTRKILWFV